MPSGWVWSPPPPGGFAHPLLPSLRHRAHGRRRGPAHRDRSRARRRFHSYPTKALPYERHIDLDRPQICLGVDERHTPDALVALAREAFAGWRTAVNEPFIGSYVPSRHYGTDARVASVMIEIRRDVYLGAEGVPDLDAVTDLAAAIVTLVDAWACGARPQRGP